MHLRMCSSSMCSFHGLWVGFCSRSIYLDASVVYGKLPIEALVTLDIESEASFHFHRIQWIELNLGPNKGRLIETNRNWKLRSSNFLLIRIERIRNDDSHSSSELGVAWLPYHFVRSLIKSHRRIPNMFRIEIFWLYEPEVREWEAGLVKRRITLRSFFSFSLFECIQISSINHRNLIESSKQQMKPNW